MHFIRSLLFDWTTLCAYRNGGMSVKEFYLLFSAITLRMWIGRMTGNVVVVGSSPIKGPRCFLYSKKHYTYCSVHVLVGSRTEFERDFTIKLI